MAHVPRPVNSSLSTIAIENESFRVTGKPSINHIVVKGGIVYYKPVKSLFKGYRRYWCRLHRETDLSPRQLVFYQTSKNNVTNYGKTLQVIPLDNVFKVAISNEKCQFDILTSNKKYSMRTATPQEAAAWVETINQEVFGPPLPGIIYEYRVRTDRNHMCKGLMADYLLKVYDHNITLFTSNGRIPTDFSCDLKDIYRINCLSTKQHKAANGFLSITIKNAGSNYQEKDILTFQAKSPIHLSKVIIHRKRLITGLEVDHTTTAGIPLSIQQEVSSSETAMKKDHANKDPMQPFTSVLHKESCRDFAKSSTGGQLKKPIPLAGKLMHEKSATKNVVSANEHQLMIDMTRSLMDITNCNNQILDLNHQTFAHCNSDLNVSPHALCKKHCVRNSLIKIAVHTPMMKNSHDIVKSLPDTAVERIHENMCNLALPHHYTIPNGVCFHKYMHKIDDHLYLEVLSDDKHTYERVLDGVSDFDDDDYDDVDNDDDYDDVEDFDDDDNDDDYDDVDDGYNNDNYDYNRTYDYARTSRSTSWDIIHNNYKGDCDHGRTYNYTRT